MGILNTGSSKHRSSKNWLFQAWVFQSTHEAASIPRFRQEPVHTDVEKQDERGRRSLPLNGVKQKPQEDNFELKTTTFWLKNI
jgi:hypothetical protein